MYEQRHHHPEYSLETPASNLEKLRAEVAQGKFKERLLKDFRLSFRFSLGVAKAQHIIVYLLGVQYFQAGESVRNAVTENLSSIEESEWRTAAQPPLQHSTESRDHIERESKAEWNKFQTHISPLHIAHEIPPAEMVENYGDLLLQLADLMIHKEIKLVHRGRPKRPSPKKASASYVREYVLGGSPSGSPTFNVLFNDMQQAMLAYPPAAIARLATAWTTRHTHEEFYPPDFMKRAEAQGTQTSFDYHPYLEYFDDLVDSRVSTI